MTRLAGRRIILTGASEGIGRALALALTAQGARVALAARDAARLEELARECRARGGETLVVPTDIANEVDRGWLVETTLQTFGGIDIVIHNAGITMWSRFDAVADFEIFERLMQVNYLAPVRLTALALRLRRRHPEAFVGPDATYAPVETGSAHALAFVRGDADGPRALVVVTRAAGRLAAAGGFGDASLAVPAGEWVEVLSGREVPTGTAALTELLADRPSLVLPDELERQTEHTLTDPKALAEELRRVRERGYAVDREENRTGVCCFGLVLRLRRPARDAISVSIPVTRLTAEAERDIPALLMRARERIEYSAHHLLH